MELKGLTFSELSDTYLILFMIFEAVPFKRVNF